MDEFGVWLLLDVNEPPRRIFSVSDRHERCVAVPPDVQQVVLFSQGKWDQRTSLSVQLDTDQGPVHLGKLTPYHKSLSWEVWEEDTARSPSNLTIKLEGDIMDKVEQACNTSAHLTRSGKECTPKGLCAPPPPRELHGKRKRGQVEEDDDPIARGQENLCPNSTTPQRRGKATPRGSSARLFCPTDQSAVTHTPPNPKGKGRHARTPTHTGVTLTGPSARWGQTLCPIDPQTAILIGGQGSRMHFCKDPMWKLCTEDMSWVTAETLAEGPTPEARIGHTATFDPDSKRIFVFGGSKNKKWFNDVHILDTQSWRWTMVEAQGKVPPLAYHSCSLFRGELFVLGGVFPRPHPEPDGCSDQLYIFNPDMAIWYQPIVNGDRPSPRSGHSACVIQGRIFVFGGWDTPVCFNDMHSLDLGLMEFSTVTTCGRAPSPRSWHGCAVLSDTKFLVHGGYNGNDALADAFIFNTDTSLWTSVVSRQLSASPRAGHSIISMAKTCSQQDTNEEDKDDEGCDASQHILVFGGGDNEGGFFSDLISLGLNELTC